MKYHTVLAAALTFAFAAINVATAATLVNVVQNSTFESGLAHWSPWKSGPGSHSVSSVADGMPGLVVELVNSNSGNVTNTTAARQALAVDLAGVGCLNLSGRVRVVQQSRRSTLYRPCEFDFPAIISLYYLDAKGQLRAYRHGFYVNSSLGYVRESTKVVAGQWFDFISPNLMDYLPYTPAQLTRVEVSGRGWDYEAQFDNVGVSICSAVPEPSSLLCLAAMGTAMPLALRLRRSMRGR